MSLGYVILLKVPCPFPVSLLILSMQFHSFKNTFLRRDTLTPKTTMVYVFSCPSVWKTPTDPPVPSSVLAHWWESTTPSRNSHPTVVLSQLYAGRINFPVLWIPGLLLPQARFFHQVSVQKKVKVKSLSPVWLFATPWTVAYQAPRSMGFSRQEYWSELPFDSPGDLPDPGIAAGSPTL